jgi:hypothetical protein
VYKAYLFGAKRLEGKKYRDDESRYGSGKFGAYGETGHETEEEGIDKIGFFVTYDEKCQDKLEIEEKEEDLIHHGHGRETLEE